MSWPRNTHVVNSVVSVPELVNLPDVTTDTFVDASQLTGAHNYIKVDSTGGPVTLAVDDAWAVGTYLHISGIMYDGVITLKSRPNAGALGVDAHAIPIYPDDGIPDPLDGAVTINAAGSVILKKVSANRIDVWDQSSVAAPSGGSGTGTNGQDGDSAYQIWLGLGNTGTQQDFIDSLAGDDGVDGLTAAQITALIEPFEFQFAAGDFGADVGGRQSLSIPVATHGKGIRPDSTVWGVSGAPLSEAAEINLVDDDSGNLTLSVATGQTFDGYVSIKQGS